MTIYFVAFAISIISYLLFSHLGHADKSSCGIWSNRPVLPFVIASFPLILVSGLRYNVGTDYFNTYYSGFYRLLEGSSFDNFEIGFVLLNKGIQLFTDNAFVLFFATSCIFVGFTFAAFRKLSPNVAFSIFLFMISRYYFIGMNGVRQMMACAVFAFALQFAIRRNLKQYLLFSLLAVSFHISVVVLLPTYMLMNFDWQPKRTVVSLAAFAIVGIVAFPFLALIIPSTSKYGVILNTYETAGTLFTFGTIAINVMLLLVYYRLYKKQRQHAWYRCFLYLQIAATAMTLLLPAVPNAERIYWSFSFFSIIAIPGMLQRLGAQSFRLAASVAIVGILSAYMVYDIAILRDHQVVPYETVIGHDAVPYVSFDYRDAYKLNW